MRKIIYFLAIALAFPILSCTNSGKPAATSTDSVSNSEAGIVYSCPMHPEVKSDKPGTCHICKMDLVKETGMATEHMSGDGMGHENMRVDSMSHDHKH